MDGWMDGWVGDEWMGIYICTLNCKYTIPSLVAEALSNVPAPAAALLFVGCLLFARISPASSNSSLRPSSFPSQVVLRGWEKS